MDPRQPPPLYRKPQRYDAIADTIDDDLEWWVQQCSHQANSRILELGCGTGRITSVLADHGHRLWGLDCSPDMLAWAQRKDKQQRCQWLLADMCDPSWRDDLPPMDGVIIGNNTIAHLIDNASLHAALANAAAVVRPGGWLGIDCFAPLPELRTTATCHLLTYHDPYSGAAVELHEKHRYDPTSQCMHVEWLHHNPSATSDPPREALTLRLWTCDDLHKALRDGGWHSYSTHGDYDGSPYHTDSPLMLIQAQRPRSE